MSDCRAFAVRCRLGPRAVTLTSLAVAAAVALVTSGCQSGVGRPGDATPSPSMTLSDVETTSQPGGGQPATPTGSAEPPQPTSTPSASPSDRSDEPGGDECETVGGFDVCGPIYVRYLELDGPDGVLGLPTSDEFPVAGGQGRGSHFAAGDIFSSSPAGAWEVLLGPVMDGWNAAGGAAGQLGFPVDEPTPQGDGLVQRFERGTVAASEATGTHLVPAPADGAWQDSGGGGGALGYPLLDQRPAVGADAVSYFQGGAVFVTGDDADLHEAPGGEVPAVDVPSLFGLALAEFVVVWIDRAADAPGSSALVWTTDGCSGPTPPEVDTLFANPCLRHDFGYRNFLNGPAVDPSQQRRLAIDNQFLVDLRATCTAAGQPQVTWFGVVVPCDRAAQLMYDAVRAFG